MRSAHRTWPIFHRAVSIILCPALLQLAVSPYLAGCAGGDRGDGAEVGRLDQLVAVDPGRNAIGRVTSTGNGLARMFFEYDALGRLTADERVLDGVSYVTRRTYGYSQASVAGPGDALLTVALPDGEVVRFVYGAGGVETARHTAAPGAAEEAVVAGIRRNARGQTTEVTAGDGWVTAYCYNETTDLRLGQIKTGLWPGGANQCASAATSILQAYQYAFDAASNVIEIRDYCDIGSCCDPALASCVAGPLSASFTYDARNRLTSIRTDADGDGTSETYPYVYDAIGNLTSKRGKVQTYGAGGRPHAIASSGPVTFSYDANGNLIAGSDGTSIDWDGHNMATRIVRRGVTTENSFVGEERWKKTENGVTSYYLGGVVVEDGRHRKYFGQQAERDPDDTSCGNAAGCLKYYHNDHLGSSTLVTDHDGEVVRRAAYWPYGEKRASEGDFDPRYEFTSQEEEGTDLYNYGARYYDPETGRFLSPDPVGVDPTNPQALNIYAYALNNPLAYVDPTGHFVMAIVWGLVAAAASMAISMVPIKELRIMLSVGMGLITGATWLGDTVGKQLIGRIAQAAINAAGEVSPRAGRILGIATALIGAIRTAVAYRNLGHALQDPQGKTETEDIGSIAGGLETGPIKPRVRRKPRPRARPQPVKKPDAKPTPAVPPDWKGAVMKAGDGTMPPPLPRSNGSNETMGEALRRIKWIPDVTRSRLPDFYLLEVSFGAGRALYVTAYGDVVYGKSWGLQGGAAYKNGWILNDPNTEAPPSKEEIVSFLTGDSFEVAGGYSVIGGGVVYSPGSGTAKLGVVFGVGVQVKGIPGIGGAKGRGETRPWHKW